MPAHQMLTGSSTFLKSPNQIRPPNFGDFRTVSQNLDGGEAAKSPLLVGSSWQLWLLGDRMLCGWVRPTLCAGPIPMQPAVLIRLCGLQREKKNLQCEIFMLSFRNLIFLKCDLIGYYYRSRCYFYILFFFIAEQICSKNEPIF